MIEIASVAFGALATVVGAFLAYRGTKTTDSTDKLTKAAGLYSDYADRMEKRVTALEVQDVDTKRRLGISEDESAKYREEAKKYRKLVVEVIQWITELLDWEARDRKEPLPHFTLAMILAHLTRSVKDELPDSDESG